MGGRVLGQSGLQLVERIMDLRILAVVTLFGLTAGTAFVAPRPVVVELFTSQGCSDCPPADALLRHVKATDLGVLALDLHVTYWDNAVWTDPFSIQAATDLQNHYASLRGGTEVYTPEAVVDGKSQFVGSNKGTMTAAVAQARAAIGQVIGRALAGRRCSPRSSPRGIRRARRATSAPPSAPAGRVPRSAPCRARRSRRSRRCGPPPPR